MNKYVIVTGANGYLGSYLVRELLNNGYNVIACKYSHFASVIIDHEKVQYVEFDISNNKEVQEILSNMIADKFVIAVLNAAALLGSSDLDANRKVNTVGVLNLIDLCRKHGIDRFIHISSIVTQKNICGPYSITKLEGQKCLMQTELNFTVFISAMILGPESLGLNRVLKNVFLIPGFVLLIEKGLATQHPVYVKDYAFIIVKSIESNNTFRKVYEVAGDDALSFREFISLILKYYDKRKIFISIPCFAAIGLSYLFEKFQVVPLFTREHVKGILQDSLLNNMALKKDLDFKPTQLKVALYRSLDQIGFNYAYYLKQRHEVRLSTHKGSKQNI